MSEEQVPVMVVEFRYTKEKFQELLDKNGIVPEGKVAEFTTDEGEVVKGKVRVVYYEKDFSTGEYVVNVVVELPGGETLS